MMTVSAAVICGVTRQEQRRVLERHGDGVVRDGLQRNLHALHHLRLDVVQRRHARRREDAAVARLLERGQRHVEVERAVHRSEREADAARRRADRQIDGGRRRRRSGRTLERPDASAQRAAVREREVRRVAERGIDAPVEAPLDAELAREVAVGLDDPRFDLDLRLRLVERFDQLRGGLQAIGQVGDDQRIGPRIDLDGAALRQRAPRQERLQLLGARVAERLGQHLQLPGERLLVGELARCPSSSASTVSGAMRTIVPSRM